MKHRIFVLAGVLPIVAAFGALIVGLGLVVFGDNGSDATVAQGSTASPAASTAASSGGAWLGISGGSVPGGKGVAITEVVSDSPAEKAGLEVGDLILTFDGTSVTTIDKLSSLVRQHDAGDTITLSVIKGGVAHPDGTPTDIEATLAARPSDDNSAPDDKQTGGGWLGVAAKDTDGHVEVTDVVDGSPADKAGIETGDVITKVDGEEMDSFHALASLIRTHSPGDLVKVTVERGDEQIDYDVTLGSRPRRSHNLPDIGGLLPGLGGILDGFSLDKLIGGSFQYLDDNGNVVTVSADAGKITAISGNSISIHPPSGDDKTFDLNADAKVPDGLAVDDQVVVISKDGTVIAVISTDLSKLLPNFHEHPNIGSDGFGGLLPNCTFGDGGLKCDFGNDKPIATPVPEPPAQS
jgi:membrane-associated protease RseP (regulator of RpoE activity)